MKKILLVSSAILLAFVLSSCSTARIANVTNMEFTSVSKQLTMDDMEQAIMKAGKRLKWLMVKTGNGQIEATIRVRGHQAVVAINYKPDFTYTIDYVSSVNLKEHNGKIHKKYNQWVRNLDHTIGKEIYNMTMATNK